MVATNEEVFSFQLEEVLSFERGQEVGDMISVFLDPDITVQSLSEDISIRGMIELQGEYERVSEEVEHEDRLLSADTFEHRNYVDKVVDIGEERAIFSHLFPVEISVPHYRITKVEDVSMEIEHFDYELMAPDEMKIQSSILIHGINNEKYDAPPLETDEEREPLFTVIDQDPFVNDDEERTELPITKEEYTSPSTEDVAPAPSSEDEEVVREEAADDEDVERTEEPEGSVDVPTRPVEETETTIGSMDEDDDQDDPEEKEDRNLDYLMSMFGDEDENGHTKVRLCIVQERDTVDSIAEKYDIQKSHIVKRNRLESEELIEGQLLHIPLKTNQ